MESIIYIILIFSFVFTITLIIGIKRVHAKMDKMHKSTHAWKNPRLGNPSKSWPRRKNIYTYRNDRRYPDEFEVR